MDVTRIIDLPSKTYIEEGDYIAIDNQQDGTQKVQFTNLFDSSLSQSDKIAPANIVGQQFTNTNTEITALRAAVGSPLKASTVAQMTDTNKIYVYTGSESGYTNGNWYYYNGTAWVSGGVYNSTALETDKTLTVSDMAADAKVVGDDITDLKSEISGEAVLRNSEIYGNSYSFSTGTINSNSSKKISDIYVPKGATVKVAISNLAHTGSGYSQIYFNLSDGTNSQRIGTVTSNGTFTGVAERDYDRVSAFCTASSAPSSFDAVVSFDGVTDSIDSLATNVDAEIKLNDDWSNYYKERTTKLTANLFNKDKAILDKFANWDAIGQPVKFGSNTSYYCYKFEPIHGVKYTLSEVNFVVLFVDENDIVVARDNASATAITDYQFTVTDDTVKYVYFSVAKSHVAVNAFMLVEGNSLPSTYVPYGYIINEDFADAIKEAEEGIYHIGATRLYKNPIEFFTAFADDDSEKTVYIDAGTYDIYDAIGGDDFIATIQESDTWRDVSIVVPRNTKLIGVGNVILTFQPSNSMTVKAASLLSPINVLGSIYMENITIIGDKCRYCIHDDGSSDAENAESKKVYKNVRLYKKRTSNLGYEQAFGAGASARMTLEFDNCIFVAEDANSVPFSCHDNGVVGYTATDDGYNMLIHDCAFVNSSGHSVRFGNVRTSSSIVPCRVQMINNYISNDIYVNAETTGAKQASDITAIKCGVEQVTFASVFDGNNDYPAHVYN